MRLLLITYLSFGLFMSSNSQTNSSEVSSEDRNNALLVAEFQKESPKGQLQHLVSYNFKNGVLVSKDTILSTPTFKKDSRYVRYEFGENFVYENRFVVSGTGNVINIKNKDVLENSGDDFVEARGDSLIFHRNNISTGTGYLLADLENWDYNFIEDSTFMNVKGIHSPNHLSGLEIDKSEIPYKIVLYDKNNSQEVIVKDCGTGTLLSSFASTMPNIPVYWTNNQCFLYATYSPSGRWMDSITATVTIHKVNIETKDSENVAQIDSVPPAISTSNFSTDPEGKIIFYCAKGQFEIDLRKKKSTLLRMTSVDNNFSIENNRNDSYGRIIEFKNKEIGQAWCNYYNAKTTEGFLAIEYGDIGSNLGYPKGVRAWNNITNEWTDIEIPWISGLIGWIEK